MGTNNDIKVFITNKNSTCDVCKEDLGNKAWITLNREKGAECLSCADLDHLVFLPSGNTALTRRTRKYSGLVAIVLKWSGVRKRYERQGLLVDEPALKRAEQDCLADEDVRARQRARQAEKRAEVNEQYIKQFSKQIIYFFPNCPIGKEKEIAEHACLKYSGRIGRTASAKSFEKETIKLAVIAHIRHNETKYDDLLAKGYERQNAKNLVKTTVNKVLDSWK